MANQQINPFQTLKRRLIRSMLFLLSYPRVQKFLKTLQPLPNIWRQNGDKKVCTEDP